MDGWMNERMDVYDVNEWMTGWVDEIDRRMNG